MVILPENKKIGFFTGFGSEYSVANLDCKQIWQSYSNVYDLMDNIPFVKNLRESHVAAMKACKSVIDGGCGTGLITRDLALSKNRKIIGVDLNEYMLKKAAYRLRNFKNVKLYHGDILHLPFEDNMFDGYISNNVLHFVEDSNKFFSEMMRVMKPGGVLSIAAARPCCDMDLLIKFTRQYFISRKDSNSETIKKVEQIIEANISLLNNVKSMYEPSDIAKILVSDYDCTVLYQGLAYLGQNFHVIAKKS